MSFVTARDERIGCANHPAATFVLENDGIDAPAGSPQFRQVSTAANLLSTLASRISMI
jgi:hypothetical protein